jgi:hypothetical protein
MKNFKQPDNDISADYFSEYQMNEPVVYDRVDTLDISKMEFSKDSSIISALCYGQRSDYECEEIVSNPDYNGFYTYREHPRGVDYTDTTKFGNGNKVRYCRYMSEDSGYVAKGLKTNREQINLSNFPGKGDNQSLWYLKPRVRIDSSFAYNNPLENVFRLEIYDYYGKLIRSVDIKVMDFLKEPESYYGQYTEEYRTSITDSLIIPSSKLLNPDSLSWKNENCKVDYRIFWYGKCDVWFDYIRLEDDVANNLFNYDINYHGRILSEISNAKNNKKLYLYNLDKIEFNNIPCIKEVFKIISEKSESRFLMTYTVASDFFYWSHVTSDEKPDFDKRKEHYNKYFCDSLKFKYKS